MLRPEKSAALSSHSMSLARGRTKSRKTKQSGSAPRIEVQLKYAIQNVSQDASLRAWRKH